MGRSPVCPALPAFAFRTCLRRERDRQAQTGELGGEIPEFNSNLLANPETGR